MANPDARERLSDAMQELETISEIMLELSQSPPRDDALLPAAWMQWLGACVCDVTKRASDAINDLGHSGWADNADPLTRIDWGGEHREVPGPYDNIG